VDLLGWGYTQLDGVKSFSASAKVQALRGFWETVGNNRQVVIGGASLGGAAVIKFASQNLYNYDTDSGVSSGFVKGTILIDAQGFVDGIGPMTFLPSPLAKLGIQVLKSTPWVEECGHVPHLEKPEETAGLIVEFLEKVKPERKNKNGGVNIGGVERVLDGLLSLMK
jgi:pimeloyl-ACP methyl ester carboxylesterase